MTSSRIVRSGLSPEIVHFRIPSDGMDVLEIAPSDWYIKGARWVNFILNFLRPMLTPCEAGRVSALRCAVHVEARDG